MNWTAIRDFLEVPNDITGKGVKIAIIDGFFPSHSEIISNQHRDTFLVKAHTSNPNPIKLTKCKEKFDRDLHGLWTASAAGGSGSLSNGKYSGVAPKADMYLIEAGRLVEDVEKNIGNALKWVKQNANQYEIRGVVLTVVGQRDTGLLPWQADPLRILCEELVHEGILVVVASGNNKEITSGSIISPSVLSVGGVTIPESGKRRDASLFPGSNGLTFDEKWNPDILAPANNVVLPFPFKSEEERVNHYTVLKDNLPPNYARQWGTSYAAPIVLGLAACLWEKHPNWTADQVKKALILSSESGGNWETIKAGLVSSQAFKFDQNINTDIQNSSYLRWKLLKEDSLEERIKKINLKNHEVIDILLSFLPSKVPDKAFNSVKKMLHHSSDRVRTVAITVLATNPIYISGPEILLCLTDDSPYVRMGGLYALNSCQHLWEELSPALCILINDKNNDIRYNACWLAARIKNKQFIKPLADGLEEDAYHKRIGTFGKRITALEAITKITVSRDPIWQEGEDPYSKRSIRALLVMAQKWKDLLD